MGSIHFTPGNCYDDAYNGNASAIHWDLVMIQREEYGGGEIYFDDRLIRRNGRFVLPEAGLPEPGEPGVGQYSRQQVRTHILLQKGYFYESL